MAQTQFLDSIDSIIKERVKVFGTSNSITDLNNMPSTGVYPLKDNFWYKIPGIICVFADIRNSTLLSASKHDKSTASIYELFTGTAVRIFHHFNPGYVDIKGDGVFALFNANQVFTAFAAAITFKTFATQTFIPKIRETAKDVDAGYHMGIDQKVVLVKAIGIRDSDGRDSRKNEVWAGKPINMAAKLASLSKDNELHVSSRYFESLGNNDLVVKSCGCVAGTPGSVKEDLWTTVDLSQDSKFDFDSAHLLKSMWCQHHGKEWCEKLLDLDSSKK